MDSTVKMMPGQRVRQHGLARSWVKGEDARMLGFTVQGNWAFSYGLMIAVRAKTKDDGWVIMMIPGPKTSRTTSRHRSMIVSTARNCGVPVRNLSLN